MQPGEISDTYANVDDLVQATGYQPDYPVEVGIANFVERLLQSSKSYSQDDKILIALLTVKLASRKQEDP